jgi:hypothetical protein
MQNRLYTVADKAIGFAPEQPLHIVALTCPVSGILKQLEYKNKGGSTGEMYLVTNNLELSTEEFKTLYKKRWSVEEYHILKLF